MTVETATKEGSRITAALPLYLAIQLSVLLFTFFETPIYADAYLRERTLTVTGWLGLWLALMLFGLGVAVLLFVLPSWRAALEARVRVKFAAGYALGVAAGLLALGLRFMPVVPAQYFAILGGLVVLGGVVYLTWRKRQSKTDELFA